MATAELGGPPVLVRAVSALTALVFLLTPLTACSDGEGDIVDQLRELDPEITDEMAACVVAELEARGLDLADSTDQEAAVSAAGEEALVACLTEGTGPPEPVDPEIVDAYGSDPKLDALWDECEEGDGDACDRLYFQAPIGSEYEEFGYSCGHRVASPLDFCATLLEPEEVAET
jgi:hypothetical protein